MSQLIRENNMLFKRIKKQQLNKAAQINKIAQNTSINRDYLVDYIQNMRDNSLNVGQIDTLKEKANTLIQQSLPIEKRITDDIKHFAEVISPSIKKRTLQRYGIPEGYTASGQNSPYLFYAPGALKKINFGYFSPDSAAIGYTTGKPNRPEIRLTRTDPDFDSSAVHEIKHVQTFDLKSKPARNAYEKNTLRRAYRFDPHVIEELYGRNYKPKYTEAEESATNAQYQFLAMKVMEHSLGRLPTPQEYDMMLALMPKNKLHFIRNIYGPDGVNGYEKENEIQRREKAKRLNAAPRERFTRAHQNSFNAGEPGPSIKDPSIIHYNPNSTYKHEDGYPYRSDEELEAFREALRNVSKNNKNTAIRSGKNYSIT